MKKGTLCIWALRTLLLILIISWLFKSQRRIDKLYENLRYLRITQNEIVYGMNFNSMQHRHDPNFVNFRQLAPEKNPACPDYISPDKLD